MYSIYLWSELSSIVLTADEVESILKILPVAKATGPNGLSNRILRELSRELSYPYCSLFNQSLSTSHVPWSYKEANLSPVVLFLRKVIYPMFQITDLSPFSIQRIKLSKDLFSNTCIIIFATTTFSLLFNLALSQKILLLIS